MLQEKIQQDLTEAMKNKNTLTISVLRMLNASLINKKIEKRTAAAKTSSSADTSLPVKISGIKTKGKQKDAETQNDLVKLSEEEILNVLSSEIKKRRDAIQQYEKASRMDLAEKEKEELKILLKYAPKQMDKEEIKKEALKIIDELGAEGQKDAGKVMGALMPRLRGKAEGETVSEVVRDLLK